MLSCLAGTILGTAAKKGSEKDNIPALKGFTFNWGDRKQCSYVI